MDVGRVILLFAKGYTLALVVAAILTLLWVLKPGMVQSPGVAGIWFAVGGFGVLVAFTIALVHLSR